MKVLMLCGSPHQNGCTYAALQEVAQALAIEGVQSEIVQIHGKVQGGCQGCGTCARLGQCVKQDIVNELIPKLKQCDGLVLGAPVHFASPAGEMIAMLDRLFYANRAWLVNKPGAAVVSCRRAGSTASLEVLQKYINYANMPLVAGQYWPMVHGSNAEEARQDREGMQIMRQLGRNMAWLIKCIHAGKAAGIPAPAVEPPVRTNFIRPIED